MSKDSLFDTEDSAYGSIPVAPARARNSDPETHQVAARKINPPLPDPETIVGTSFDSKGKLATMLDRLKLGPLSTFEAERFIHRGQATIHQLQQQGHRINLEWIDGIQHYVYVDFRKQVRVSKTLQEKYYATRHWRTKAAERKELDGFRCRQCGATEKLQTHHWRYNLFAENVRLDLITLCEECHKRIHSTIKGSGVHFPNHVEADLAARIEHGDDDTGSPVESQNGIGGGYQHERCFADS